MPHTSSPALTARGDARCSADRPRGAAQRGVLIFGLALLAACADTRIAPSYPGTLLLVAEDATNTLAEIEPNGGHVRHRYVATGPITAIATARNGQYAAAISSSGAVDVGDLARQGQDAAWSLSGGGVPSGLVFSDRRTTLAASFAGSGEVLLVGRESGRVGTRIATGCSSVVALALTAEGDSIWALCDGPPTLARLDPEQGNVVERVRLPATPISMAAGEGAASSWIALAGADGVDAWSSAHGRVALGQGPIALAGSFDAKRVVASSCARGALALIATDGTGEIVWVSVGSPEPSAARAWPVLVDPDGRNAFVSVPHEGRVVVVDLGQRIVRGAFPLGNTPGAIAWTFMRAPPEYESDSDSGAR